MASSGRHCGIARPDSGQACMEHAGDHLPSRSNHIRSHSTMHMIQAYLAIHTHEAYPKVSWTNHLQHLLHSQANIPAHS